MSYDDIPPELAGLSQFCLRKEKKPWIRDTANGGFTPKWTDQAGWMKLAEALDELKRNKDRFDGVGYLNTKALDDSRQITGGDLDACRDPITGWVSPWALELLEQTKPFYCEISPSGCGLRFFYLARLPNRVDSLFGNGPQELPDDVKEHIIVAKPTIKEKMDKGEPVFNSIELYENKRHLTLTGNTLKDFCHPIEDKTEALAYALALAEIVTPEKPKATLQAAEIEQIKQNMKRKGLTDEQINAFLESKGMNPAHTEGCQGAGAGCYEMPGWVNDMSKEANKNRLPPLNILDVIDTRGWEISGAQLRGPHPTLGSTTGHNLVVNPEAGLWAYMHNGINSGGDAWIWLACECGAVKWEEAGAGALKDPAIKAKTVAYAKSKKLIPEDALPPHIAGITLDSEVGSIGMLDAPGHKYNGAICQMERVESKETGYSIEPKFLSDCAVYIHTETTEDGKTEFQLRGRGRKDGRVVFFSATPEMLTDPRKFHSLLMHQFGGLNRVNKLNTDILQQVSRDVLRKERVTIPRWRDNIPLIPGLDMVADVEFKLSQLTPAAVYDGDIEQAKDLFKHILEHRRYSPLLITVILGAPVMAKWFKNDRFGIALWGQTGSHKTTIARCYSAVYGLGFLDERTMLKHGQQGGTAVGAMESILQAGILPRIIDNVKATDPKDFQRYVSLIHAVIEGGEKLRGKKDGGLREIHEYLSTPIITGEIKPSEASTSARVLNLSWSKVQDNGNLTYIQEHNAALPIIGYHWLKFLATAGRDIRNGFDEARSKKTSELSAAGYVNPGRLATIYCLMRGLWGLIKESPLGDVAQEYDDLFIEVLDEAIATQGYEVNNETEISKFLSAIKELQVSRPELFMVGDIPAAGFKPIGRETDLGLFLFPAETLAVLKQLNIFTQVPSKDSITKALKEEGLLRPIKENEHSLNATKINGKRIRGWWLKAGWDEDGPGTDGAELHEGDNLGFPDNTNPPGTAPGTPKRYAEPPVPGVPVVPGEKEREIFEKKLEQNSLSESYVEKNAGNSGNRTNKSIVNKSIDIDYISSRSSSRSVPGVPGEQEDKDCGKCVVALKGDKTAIKCHPCSFLGEVQA